MAWGEGMSSWMPLSPKSSRQSSLFTLSGSRLKKWWGHNSESSKYIWLSLMFLSVFDRNCLSIIYTPSVVVCVLCERQRFANATAGYIFGLNSKFLEGRFYIPCTVTIVRDWAIRVTDVKEGPGRSRVIQSSWKVHGGIFIGKKIFFEPIKIVSRI